MTARLFEYVVWFRDLRVPSDDEDFEWPAVFAIEARSSAEARTWGDELAKRYCGWEGASLEFVRADVADVPSTSWDELPTVRAGVWASDDEIGW